MKKFITLMLLCLIVVPTILTGCIPEEPTAGKKFGELAYTNADGSPATFPPTDEDGNIIRPT